MRPMSFSLILAGGLAIVVPAAAQTQPSVPPGSPAVTEIQRQIGSNPAVPYVPQQNRAAAAADAMDAGAESASQFLMQARQAVERRRLGVANEMLERAATRVLTRSTLATEADRPMQSMQLQHINAARAAVLRRDAQAAMQEIDQALAGG